ncbi:PAS domain-containing protein [Desulfonauticus submarinus]
MLKNFAIIGPKKKIASFVRAYLRSKDALRSLGRLVAITITDGEKLISNYPCYKHWEEMIKHHVIDSVFNLETNPDFIFNLRQKLPPNIQLSECSPSYSFITLHLMKTLFQKKAAKKENFLSQILENTPFATIIFNAKGEVIYWNKACETLTGIPRKMVIGKSDIGLAFYDEPRPLLGQNILKYDYEELRNLYQANDFSLNFSPVPNGLTVSGFWELRGKIKGFYQIIAVKLIQKEKVVGSLEIIQNISNIYQLRSQVQEYEKILEVLLNSLPYPLIYSLNSGRIVYINKAGKKLFQKKLKKQGATVFDLLNTPKKEAVSPEILLSGEKKTVLNLSLQNEDWEITILCLSDKGYLWLFRNLTEAESKQKLDLVLSLAGAISHELSQPLTAVVNAAELLANTPPNNLERIKKHQKIILKEGAKLFQSYSKLRNIDNIKLTSYLGDTQILDIHQGNENLFQQISPPTKGEKNDT